jgi:hypothetical protein
LRGPFQGFPPFGSHEWKALKKSPQRSPLQGVHQSVLKRRLRGFPIQEVPTMWSNPGNRF